jgi:hypothetical protein
MELSFSIEDLGIDPKNIAKLMGYKTDIPEEIMVMINFELEKLHNLPGIKGGYEFFDVHLDVDGYKLLVEDKTFCVGKSVSILMQNATKLAMFVCTAGALISNLAKDIMEKGEFLEAYILDVIGSEIVEKVKDKLHNHLHESVATEGLKCTNSYCPGYCTWSVSEQSILFSFFEENFCDVQLSESCMMKPVKSLSGIIGIGKDVEFKKHACETCSSVKCIYRGTRN